MDGHSSMVSNFENLDLNQEPSELVVHKDTISSNTNTTMAKERKLKSLAVAMQCCELSQSQNPVETGLGILDGNNKSYTSTVESTAQRRLGFKRKSSDLVAKALESISPEINNGGNACNVCLSVVTEPVLACCGHLFCSACYYNLPWIDLSSKGCPVCGGEIQHSNVIPIQENCRRVRFCGSDSGLMILPRPKGHRVESLQQLRIIRGPLIHPLSAPGSRIGISTIARGDQAYQEYSSDSVILRNQNSNPSVKSLFRLI